MGLFQRFKSYVGFGVNAQGFTIPSHASSPLGQVFNPARSLANAHRNSVVCAVTNWITDQASTTPMVLRRARLDGDIEIVTSHPLLDLLRTPSEFLSGRELLSVSVWDLILRGQSFWHKDRTGSGVVAGLSYLPADKVEVKGSAEELITEYLYRPDGRTAIRYDVGDVVHIRLKPNPFDPKNGLSPLACVAYELYIDSLARQYTASTLTTQGAPGGLLMPADDEALLTEEVADATRKFIREDFAGTGRGQLGVLRSKMDFLNTSLDPGTIMLRTIQTTCEERICGALGVHPVIVSLGAGSAQSRVGAATKELERAAQTNRIIPMQDTFGEQIGRQLLPEFVPEEELLQWSVGWDRSEVLSLQPDKLQEAQRWAISVRAAVATRYDARRAQGLAADDTDKVYMVASNIIPIPADAPPPPPLPPAEETTPNSEPQERSRVAKTLLALAQTKAELDSEQRALLLVLARDAEGLEAEFTEALTVAFEDLGERAVEAFWEVEGGKSVLSGGRIQVKQDEEIAEEVSRILQALKITQWEQGILIPAWDGHMLRTLNMTVGSVNTTLGLQVNIPDPVSRRIIAEGGIRRGLVDVTEQTRQAIFRGLYEGRSNGEGPIQLGRRIREQVPAGPYPNAGSKYRSQLIARTETAYAQNVSAIETYRQAEVFVGVLISDGDEDEVCAAVNGRRVSFVEWDAIGELAHPNCTRSAAPIREL